MMPVHEILFKLFYNVREDNNGCDTSHDILRQVVAILQRQKTVCFH